jgi:hypothetical protein
MSRAVCGGHSQHYDLEPIEVRELGDNIERQRNLKERSATCVPNIHMRTLREPLVEVCILVSDSSGASAVGQFNLEVLPAS